MSPGSLVARDAAWLCFGRRVLPAGRNPGDAGPTLTDVGTLSVLGNTFGTRTRGEGVGSASRASILTGLGAEGRQAVPPSGRCRGINDSTRRATEI